MKTDKMLKAYLEAVAFTDFGEGDQPPTGSEFSQLAMARAWSVCQSFLYANEDLIGDNLEQAGHDLWLTRNGHGAGFWDRPEVYGEANADVLTRCAKCLGNADVYQGNDGLVYFG